NQWARCGTLHFLQGRKIWSTERPIACNIGVNKALYAYSTQFSSKYSGLHTRRFAPSRDSNPTIASIQPYHDTLVPACKRLLQQHPVGECYRTKYDPLYAQVEY